MRILLSFLTALFLSSTLYATNFYVDPDWPGAQNGTATQPWATLTATSWNTINAALTSNDVTVYFPALKADGATQQSVARFIQGRRTDASARRLTLDGYSFYNSSETAPAWVANPDTDIGHAYLSGKVFKLTGNGSSAIGWTRTDGNDFVTHNGLVYCCIESHVASLDSEPGVGANWALYWDQHGATGPEWSPSGAYRCYTKQNNVTIRGFEITGAGARSSVNGDNLVWEYNYIHDITGIGPALSLLYTSHPDSSAAQIISRPSVNLVFHDFKIERTFGEGFYLGSINPDAPGAFQLAHGNQHGHILIENFLITQTGINGGQGDGIDCKNGITNLTIRLGEISAFQSNGNGINLPYSATNVDEAILVERLFIHDPVIDGLGAQIGIHAQTGGALSASLYGYNGVTIRNNVVANCRTGIQFAGSALQPATFGAIFNNTIYGATPNGGLAVSTNVSDTLVGNNFVFGGANPRGLIGSSGVASDYNAHDGTWTSAAEGPHTLTMTSAEALLSVVNVVGNFHLIFGTRLISVANPEGTFLDDFDGMTRGLLWDIGAFEFDAGGASPTPTPTATATVTPTSTPVIPSPSPSPTQIPSATPTATVAQSPSPSPTDTPSPSATSTPHPTRTPRPKPTPKPH